MAEQFNADLNIIQSTPIQLELLDGDLNIIQQLDDEPNDVGGLTSGELKAKFDEAGNIIKQYINETLIPAVLADDATEQARNEAEAGRVAAENARNIWERYDPAKTYVPGNKISFDGSSYLCVAECTGITPTDPGAACWLLIAAKGDKGETGPQGPQGDKGDQGPPGSGNGDMEQRVYDTHGKERDVFDYADESAEKAGNAALLIKGSYSLDKTFKDTVLAGSAVCSSGNLYVNLDDHTQILYAMVLGGQLDHELPLPPNGGVWGCQIVAANELVTVETGTNGTSAVMHDKHIVGSMNWKKGRTEHMRMVYDDVHGTYVVSRDGDPRTVMVSKDLVSWTEHETGAGQGDGEAMLYANGAIILHTDSENGFIYRSTDGGYTWARVMDTPGGDIAGTYLLVYGNGTILAIKKTPTHHTYRSTDDGATWEYLSMVTGMALYDFKDAAYYNNRFEILTNMGTSKAGSKIVDTANGTSWSSYFLPVYANWEKLIPVDDGSKLLVLGADGEIAYSSDTRTWDNGEMVLRNADGQDISPFMLDAIDAMTYEVVSYQGTGKSGSGSFSFVRGARPLKFALALDAPAPGNVMLANELGESYSEGKGFQACFGAVVNKAVFMWYGDTPEQQLNELGKTYTFLLFE